jgi:hypothetical protein
MQLAASLRRALTVGQPDDLAPAPATPNPSSTRHEQPSNPTLSVKILAINNQALAGISN